METSPEIIYATQKIIELFNTSGMKVDPFERAIGVTQGTIKNIRNGRNYASADCIIKVAKYFGVSTDYLLGVSHSTDVKNFSNSPITVGDSNIVQSTVNSDTATDELIELYQSFSPAEKKILLGYAERIVAERKK